MASLKVKPRPKAVDLFCGAGGMSVGLEQAGFDIAYGVDSDGYHSATHERNFPYGKSDCLSVTELTAKHIFEACGSDRIELVCGGPPCQGFSNMGHRDVLDPRNSLVFEFCRIVSEVRPSAFIMENVPGMLSGTTKPILDEALKRFRKAGYRIVSPIRVLDASDFGAPQRRKRVIVLGIRVNIGVELEYPSGPAEGTPPRPNVIEAIGDLPDVDKHDELFECNFTPYDRAPHHPYAKFSRGMERNPFDYSYPRIWNHKVCTGCLRVRHSASAIARYESTLPGEMVESHKLPRLDPNGLSPTLRAGSDSTHGSYTAPRPIHPIKPRCITVREAARLHGFPDWFVLYPNRWHSYRQIGNAVCPPLARALGESVLRALNIKPKIPKLSIALGDVFHLPVHRPRSLKRLPEIVHFPPVIESLFRERYDEQSGLIKRSRFSFDDVLNAINTTGVTINGIRADTFIGHIARSRNVDRLLHPCLKYGFTICARSDDSAIGEFVPRDHPDGIKPKKDRPLIQKKQPRLVSNGQKTLW